ncbi:hypothetical protein SAMN02745866_01199 [Alteromonadaceae bacterium Bs31]|nr:hypothetical protein SAMN02745866_01199 [Alteromonadaceae bacterium Bs31]
MLNKYYGILLAILFFPLFGLSVLANADAIYTSQLANGLSTNVSFNCQILNTSDQDIENAKLEFYDHNGILRGISYEYDIPAGTSVQAGIASSEYLSVYCRVSGRFPKSSVLVNLSLIDQTPGKVGRTLVSVPGYVKRYKKEKHAKWRAE